ncbi:MAG: nucleoside-diphosphate sugar epimerase/dehydratase [Stappiaceae bacterium]
MAFTTLKKPIRSLPGMSARQLSLYAFDLTLCGVALALSCLFRVGFESVFNYSSELSVVIPAFMVICAFVFPTVGLYNRQWRYASIMDVIAISKAVFLASATFAFLLLLIFGTTGQVMLPRSVIAIEIPVLMCLLFATRLAFRVDDFSSFAQKRSKRSSGAAKTYESVPVLLVGAGDAGDLYLRALQRDTACNYYPVGFLDNDRAKQGLTHRGVPVLGTYEKFDQVIRDLEAKEERPRRLIFTELSKDEDKSQAERLIEKAEGLGITVSQLTSPTELRSTKKGDKFELRPIELTDLLLRPQAALDGQVLKRMIEGRRVLLTGAGGSIGSELAKQVVALNPSEIVLIENNELNMYSIELELNELALDVPRHSYLCNIRDAGRVNEIFSRHRPELVFHAAALKHVPIVELNPCEGVLTNVIGTMNIADAARRTNALAMVQISTDKVVNSTGVMGATKRLAELYCQALDLDGVGAANSTRFMTVRFGNVLGSSGSLIPLFQRQLAKGGPLTVTDPEMTRFFMTVREAVELTLQASACGLEERVGEGEIFVLDMGEPVKILDVARRMIRLAGLTPDVDVNIEFIGCRPGEKLFEELFDSSEKRVDSPIPGVLGAMPNPVPLATLKSRFTQIHRAALRGEVDGLFEGIQTILPNYKRKELTSEQDANASETSNEKFEKLDRGLDIAHSDAVTARTRTDVKTFQRRHTRLLDRICQKAPQISEPSVAAE